MGAGGGVWKAAVGGTNLLKPNGACGGIAFPKKGFATGAFIPGFPIPGIARGTF